MAKMLYGIRWEGTAPTLEEVRQRFGFEGDDVDEEFGVVATDPEEHMYAILVEESAVSADEASIEGPFSDPRIEPFDLQEPAEGS